MRKCSRSSRDSVFELSVRYTGRTLFEWVLILAWVLGYILSVTLAEAQDAPAEPELPTAAELSTQCAPSIEANRRAALSHDGDQGFWFHGDVARCLLQRYSLVAPFAQRVELLEARLQLQSERDALQERRVALAVQEAETATGTLEAAVRRAREAEEARDAWYRSPALWFAVGVVATVVLEVVAIWAISEVAP